MPIVDTLTKSNFVDRMRDVRPENFSYEALGALYDYLEEYSESIGEPIEFDPIALCCDFEEWPSLDDLKCSYDFIKSFEDLEDHTVVIYINGHNSDAGFIIQQF